MKKILLCCFAIVGMLSFFSCSSDQDVMKESLETRVSLDSMNIDIQDEIEKFEKSYFQNVKTKSDNQVKMFGFKTMKLEEGKYCVTRRDVCMDFNGFGSDCVKGPKTYFVGSDCQRAMLQGHCWNEIM